MDLCVWTRLLFKDFRDVLYLFFNYRYYMYCSALLTRWKDCFLCVVTLKSGTCMAVWAWLWNILAQSWVGHFSWPSMWTHPLPPVPSLSASAPKGNARSDIWSSKSYNAYASLVVKGLIKEQSKIGLPISLDEIPHSTFEINFEIPMHIPFSGLFSWGANFRYFHG